jgi:hypothetical protein
MLDGGDVVALFYLEEPVDDLQVETELQDHHKHTQETQDSANQGIDKVENARKQCTRGGDVDPTVEGLGGAFETLDTGTLATAIVHKNVRHMLASHTLTLGAGASFGKIFADMGDFIHHILSGLVPLVNQFLEFAHSTPPS